MTELLRKASSPRGQLMVDHCTMVNGKFLFATQPDESMIIDLLDLNQLDGNTLNDSGDKYVIDENNHQLIKIAASRSTAETLAYFKTPFTPPAYVIDMFYGVLRAVATIWKRSHD
jgi:hypothetical protein